MVDVLTDAAPAAAAPATPGVETPPAVVVEGSPTPAPAALPAATPVAVVTPEPVIPVTPELRSYVREIEFQNAQARQQALLSARQEFVAKRAGEYEAVEGIAPETALKLAERDGNERLAQIQAEDSRQNQINAAFDVAAKYKVDPRYLMNLPSVAAMEQAAVAQTQRGAEQGRIKALEEEVARLKKAPATTYASGAVSGDGMRPTADNIDVLYGQGKVSDAVYKTFLRTGQIN